MVTVHRDRENSTVFVTDLPHGVTDDDLKQLFKDVRMLAQFICSIIMFLFFLFYTKCGSIREVKITQLPGSFVATVEFFERVGRLVEIFLRIDDWWTIPRRAYFQHWRRTKSDCTITRFPSIWLGSRHYMSLISRRQQTTYLCEISLEKCVQNTAYILKTETRQSMALSLTFDGQAKNSRIHVDSVTFNLRHRYLRSLLR